MTNVRCWLLAIFASGCNATHALPDVGFDAAPACSEQRSATLAVITNFDSARELGPEHAAITVELVDRLLRGDPDGDGIAEELPLDRVRVLTTPNEALRSPTGSPVDCTEPTYGAAWTSILLDTYCPDSPHVGNPVFDVAPGDDFRDDLFCLLSVVPHSESQCPGQTFDVALAALSPRDAPVDLAPLMGLGDSTNVAYRERDDVLVVVFQSGDLGDDCSHRTYALPQHEGLCTDPGERPVCCEENLAPVTRTSDALRTILAGRPTIYAGYAQFDAFDPSSQTVAELEAMIASPDPSCAYAGTHHTRTARLAAALYPDMHLLPTACTGDGGEGPVRIPDVTALAREVFSRICD